MFFFSNLFLCSSIYLKIWGPFYDRNIKYGKMKYLWKDCFFLISFEEFNLVPPEAATRGVLCKKVFLEIWQNSQENIQWNI